MERHLATLTDLMVGSPALGHRSVYRDGAWRPVPNAVFDVRDYGAKGDSTTDDRASIQAAIDAANTVGGGVVVFPASATDYLIASPLTLSSGVILRGAGRRKTRVRVNATSVNAVNLVGTSAASSKTMTGIEDLAFIGPGKTAGGTGIGLNVKWVKYGCTFARLQVYGFASHGIAFEDSYTCSFQDLLIDSCGGDGIHALTNVNACDFRGILAFDCGGSGIQIVGGAGNRIGGCDLESNDAYGLDLRYVYGTMVEGNYFELNALANVYLHHKTGTADKCNGVTLVGNYLGGGSATPDGILVDGANRTTIVGNTLNLHLTNHLRTTANAVRTCIGPNHYLGAAVELADASGSTGGVDYDATNLWNRSRGKHFFTGEIEIDGALNHDGTTFGFAGAAPGVPPTVTGSRGGNAALASLLTGLAARGLIVDSTTA